MNPRTQGFVNGLAAGVLAGVLLCGAVVALVDSRRRAAEAENEAAWFRTCQAAWDRGWEAGRRLERDSVIFAGGLR